jgi:hypothetical protein
MKKSFFTFIAFLLSVCSFATILRVNNNPGIIAVNGLVYNNLQAAITDATPNDTLYIEPSSINYTITSPISKKLHFIGNGYRINENQTLISPLPYEVKKSQISSSFQLNAGSEGSTFRSISFFNTTISVNANQMVFSRCNFEPFTALTLLSSNNIVEQCFGFSQATINGSGINNIFRNIIWEGGISSQNHGIFDQCYVGNISSITNCVITNSIIRTYSSLGVTNSISFSIKINDSINPNFPNPGINNNIENVAIANIFVENPGIDTFDKSFRYTINSIALNNGSSGQHIGPFGGIAPYILSGQPPIPVVTNFVLETTGSTASGLSGSITIQSNN